MERPTSTKHFSIFFCIDGAGKNLAKTNMFETFGIFGEADTMPQVALCFGEGGGIVGNRKRSRPLRQQAFICDARHTFAPAGRSNEPEAP